MTKFRTKRSKGCNEPRGAVERGQTSLLAASQEVGACELEVGQLASNVCIDAMLVFAVLAVVQARAMNILKID